MDRTLLIRYALIAMQVVVVIFSVMAHELAHGLAAWRLGDPTAKRAGRLTINPLAHIDPFGTVILPLIMAISAGAVFGYAKPVPYNPSYFKHRRRDELIVAFAGPLTNLALGCVGAAIMWGAIQWAGQSSATSQAATALSWVLWWALQLGYQVCLLNFVLFFFNIVPMPPLDGSTILASVLPEHLLGGFYRLKNYAMPALLLIVVVLPMATGLDPFGWYLRHTAGALAGMLTPAALLVR